MPLQSHLKNSMDFCKFSLQALFMSNFEIHLEYFGYASLSERNIQELLPVQIREICKVFIP